VGGWRSSSPGRRAPRTGEYALSGDGRTVVQSADAGGRGGLVAIEAPPARAVPPVASATAQLLEPSLSGPGTRLAFFSTATDLAAGAAGAVGQAYATRLAPPR
jgi:hypothetical protein